MLRLLLTISFLWLLNFTGYTQMRGKALADSLLNILPHVKDDTSKVNILATLCYVHRNINTDLGLQYGEEAFRLATKLNWPRGITKAYINTGVIYKTKGNIQKAAEYYERAREQALQSNDKFLLALVLNNIGVLHVDRAEYQMALDYYKQAYRLHEEMGNKTQMASLLNNIGIVYRSMSDFNAALDYINRALRINQATGNLAFISDNYHSMGFTYYSLSQYSKALEYYFMSLKLVETLGNKNGQANTLNNIGSVYLGLKDKSNALKYYQQALALNKEVGNQMQISQNLNNIGLIYEDESDYEKAIAYYKESIGIAEQINYSLMVAGCQNNMGHLYKKLKNYKASYNYYTISLAAGRKINDQDIISDGLIGMTHIVMDAPDDVLTEIGVAPAERRDKALELAVSALDTAKESESVSRQAEALKLLSEVHEYRKEFIPALELYKRYIELSDSSEGDEQKQAAAKKEMQYEFSKREDSLRFQQTFIEHQLVEQNQKLLIASKDKEVQHLAFLASQAALEAEADKSKANGKALIIAKQEKSFQAAALKLKQTELALRENEIKAKKLERNFYISGSLFIIIAGGYSFHRFRKRKELQNRHAILNERLRISRDLHDDMGATLSSISIYSSAVKQRLSEARIGEAQTMLDTISEDARDMVSNMSDMVWMINPQNDLMEKLTDRMQSFASNVLIANNTLCRFHVDDPVRNLVLPMEMRKNIFLIFKEAINNTAKYSGASEVDIRIAKYQDELVVVVQDNGKGFSVDRMAQGNGLQNMKERAAGISGTIVIGSAPGKGCRITLALPSPKMGSKHSLS